MTSKKDWQDTCACRRCRSPEGVVAMIKDPYSEARDLQRLRELTDEVEALRKERDALQFDARNWSSQYRTAAADLARVTEERDAYAEAPVGYVYKPQHER